MLIGMLVALVVFSIPATPDAEAAARDFLPWAGGFYASFLVPIFAFISAAGAMRDDFSDGTVDYVFTRPVSRSKYVVFRYLAQMGCTQIDFLAALAVVAGIGAYHGVPGLWSALPYLLVGQAMAILVFSAFGLFCGTLTSRYVILGLAYAGIVEVGLGNVPTQINQISLVRHVLGILRPVLGGGDGALLQAATTTAMSTPGIIVLLLTVSAAFVGLTAVMFGWREFAGAGVRDA